MNDRMTTVSNSLLAFLVGAAAGAAVAYLTAPKTGQETRETLKDWASSAGQTASRVPRAVSEAYNSGARAAKEAFAASMRESEGRTDA